MASKAEGSGARLSRQRSKKAASEKPLKDEAKAASTPAAKPKSATKSTSTATSRRRSAAKAPPALKATAAEKPAAKPASKTAAKPTTSRTSKATTRKPAANASRSRAAAPKKAEPETKNTPDKTLADVATTRGSKEAPSAVKAAANNQPAADAAKQVAQELGHEGVALAAALTENLERIELLNHRLMKALSQRKMPNLAVEMPGPDLYMAAASGWVKALTEQPARIIGQQVNFWGETLRLYARTQEALARNKAPEDEVEDKDKRFANPLWHSHPFFAYVRRQYEINAEAMASSIAQLDLPDATARKRVNWLTAQIIDMLAPTNFLATNPDALERAVKTDGESLVKGLENLVRDVELNSGDMLVSLADRDAFTVGENIGTTEGRVVHRTALYELIQYAPRTEQVYETPLVIFPPWINKFYILDLKPQNSLIRWLVEQGQTVFVMSWKNPDPGYADVGMDHYVAAYLDAMEKVLALTKTKELNAVGYCIAGTTLALTLALMAKKGDHRIKSATFFTTLTDFSDLGEFTTYLQDDFVDGLEAQVQQDGVLKSQIMSRTMSFLRPNDLVWGPAIRSYMMGEAPPAFDLLYWNGDSTNLPARMTIEYLRQLCQGNAFATRGFEVMGETVHLSDVSLPVCSVACETDHIAPWKDCWRGLSQMGSTDKRFILSESGHIGGIVNPPSKKKYGHYTGSDDFSHGHEAWRDDARFGNGSWWPVWDSWLAERSGPKIPAREPEEGFGPAPGAYVHERGGLKSDA